ncbi:uncharacterized protein LOC125532252 [Triticum urartu]|uniref:uncharacterized protein LOC125532252 n=1 Tax=Triticum urartu TaxID=4572 RepID=UPI002042E6C0|nr:uncharacterized protein LOC125532252 [Triticum urartu]
MHALSDLPDDVLMEIVVRLPAHSIARCRAVCRAWRSAISHASFDTALARRPAAVATVTADRLGFEFRTDYTYALEGTTPTLVGRTRVVFDFFLRWRRRPPCPQEVRLISDSLSSIVTTVRGSWDGVLCIERGVWKWKTRPLRYHVEQYLLWNPVTKACATVSPPADRGKIIGGYAHPTTGAFHLVHGSGEVVNDHLMAPTTFLIGRVGDDMAWREIPLELEEASPTDDAQPSKIFISSNRNARCVGLRGNLHWLALSGSGTLRILAFDTSSQDRFRQIEAPELGRGPADLTKVRLGARSGGKLCIFSVAPSMSSMDVWVLDGYCATVRRSSWRRKERISFVSCWTFNAATEVEVEVVEGVGEGEEIFLHFETWIDVYNIQCKTWRRDMEVPGLITLGSHESLVMHRESALQHEVSFGDASRAVSRRVDSDGTHRYNVA